MNQDNISIIVICFYQNSPSSLMTIPSLALASGEIFLISSDLKLNRNYIYLANIVLKSTVIEFLVTNGT
jgi:hypothetical protein